MALVGAVITDDALFGIPEPDYSDEEDVTTNKQQTKQLATTTLSNESNRSESSDRVATNEQSGNTQHKSTDLTDSELGVPHPDYGSDDDDTKKSADCKSKQHNDVITNESADSKCSQDGGSSGLISPFQDSNRSGSFRRSGSGSPISPILGVSHEHVAVDPVLIEPKKVSNVPILSKEQKELQRELQFKQKQGNMLEKKPELQKVMEDRKFKMKKEEQKKDQECNQSTLNVKLGKQAKKLLQMEEQEEKKQVSKTNSSPSEQQLNEFQKIHSKIHKNKLTNN